jgi:uncharacterized protein (DUF58 family)
LNKVIPVLEDLLQLARSASLLQAQARVRPRIATLSGSCRSTRRGRGMEFDESRPYAAGDDARNLDWRVTARTSRPHTKLFREEQERPVLIAVDYRATMRFATRGVFKTVMAARMAAVLAWLAEQRGDRIGGCIFAENGLAEIRPQRGRNAVLRWLDALVQQAAVPPGSATGSAAALASALTHLPCHARPGSVVFVLSDFRQLESQGLVSLTRLARHCEVVLVFIHDPLEQHLPPGRLNYASGDRQITLVSDERIQTLHAAAFMQRKTALEQFARRHRIRLVECSTGDDPVSVLWQSGV